MQDWAMAYGVFRLENKFPIGLSQYMGYSILNRDADGRTGADVADFSD